MSLTHSAFPVGKILTNGLGGEACAGSLTATFRLICGVTIAIPPTTGGYGGGTGTMIGANFDNLPNQFDSININNKCDGKRVITIQLKMHGKTKSSDYLISDKICNGVINITNLCSGVGKKIKIILHNLRMINK